MRKHTKIYGVALIALVIAAVGALAAMNWVRDSGTVTYSNTSAAISAGDIVDLTGRYGIAMGDIASNATGVVRVEGVFDLRLAATNETVAVGQSLFRNSATNVTTTAASNTYIGQATEAKTAASTAPLINVDLNASVRAVTAEMINAGGETGSITYLNATDSTQTMGVVSGVITNSNQ